MAVEGNGREAEPATKGTKGTNGQAIAPSKRAAAPKAKKGLGLISIILRLVTWYSIITVLFRCPASIDELTDSTPKICKPYFHLRSVVAPHVGPYYDEYAGPYVDAARPYYDTLNERVITPATALGAKYGAPRVAQAQAYGQAQWEKNLQPQVLKVQGVATEQYNQHLAPHLEKATVALGPYYDIARTNALQTYYEFLLPAYTTVQPYALQGYDVASDFTLNTAIPYSQWAVTTTGTFLERTVFPKLRILYGENVEPQLMKISERLGRYREGKKLKSIIDDIDSSSSVSSIVSSASSVAASTATPPTTAEQSTSTTTTEAAPEATPLSEEEIREKAQKVVAADLETWQEKFAKAADEGSEYLDEHITEITDRLVKNQAAKVGAALNIQLEEKVQAGLKDLKRNIISIVGSDGSDEEKEEALKVAVRKAGVGIKEKAQAVRTWRQSFDRELTNLVSKSAEDTFEILDHIRDLGLQEIGMRWAWTDGITHKDWAKYHKLKSKFDEWRLDVEKIVSEHEGVAKGRAASEDVESKAMGTAEEAAKELARIRDIGRWKLSVGDVTDDWTTRVLPAAAAVAGEKIKEKLSEASEAIVGTSQGTIESVTSSVADVASSISSAAAAEVTDAESVLVDFADGVSSAAAAALSSVIGEPQATLGSIVEAASQRASSIANQLSDSIVGTQQDTVESVTSAVSESASSIVDEASSSIIETPESSVESAASSASTEASSLAAKASSSAKEDAEEASSSIDETSSIILGSASSLADDATEIASSASSEASEDASEASSWLSDEVSEGSASVSSVASEASSTASKKVWGGAEAQFVEAKSIVLDDVAEDHEDVFSEKVQSLASEAGDRFADVTRAVSEALHRPTSTGGAVTDLAADRYSSAIHAASVALYGTEQGPAESVASVVTSRYSDAVEAASSVIFGTPTPVTESIAAAATQVYNDAQVALESVSSVAASRLSEGLSSASSLLDAGKGYVGSVPTDLPDKQKVLAQLEEQYHAGVGLAHARYTEFLSAASAAIPTATPTPWTESAASAASSNFAAIITKVSSEVYGQPTPALVTRNILSEAGQYASAVADNAASQYSAVQSIVGELVAGKEAAFTESFYSRLSSAYFTGAVEVNSYASVYANEAYTSATSALNAAFTPPPALEAIIEAAQSRVNEAVEAASIQIYGTTKGPYEQATSSAAAAYSSVQSAMSERVYGTQKGYAEAAQSSIADAASSASRAISEAVYGTPTPTDAYGSASSAAGEAYSTASAYLDDSYSKVSSRLSSAVYGAEQGAIESAQNRLGVAVESARARLGSFASAAADAASSAASRASEGVNGFASNVSSAVGSATSHFKEEL